MSAEPESSTAPGKTSVCGAGEAEEEARGDGGGGVGEAGMGEAGVAEAGSTGSPEEREWSSFRSHRLICRRQSIASSCSWWEEAEAGRIMLPGQGVLADSSFRECQ